MLKRAYILLLTLLLLPCAPAQEAPVEDEPTIHDMPQWLIDFSNLTREEREAYLTTFNKAKQAYQRGEWVACYGYLADCEMIFNGNPNVWNLSASCLIEQKYFDEAAVQLEKVLKVMPNDSVAVMNQANLYLATERYAESIAVIDRLLLELPPDTPSELTDVLTYRKVLALVLLDKTPEAKKLVAHLNAFSDTPLYYYSQAAFYLAEDKKVEAARSLRSVGKIFAKSASLASYQRALELSRLAATDSPR